MKFRIGHLLAEDGEFHGSRSHNRSNLLTHTRQEGTTPPWDETTTFNKLETKLKQLKDRLPEHLQLTPENTQDQIYHGSDKYVLIHTVYTLCTVWLYREYMAMAPWGLSSPSGPLDEPLILKDPPERDYWIKQAKACFGACRDYADLLYAVQLHAVHPKLDNKLVETPIVAFAAYTVSWSSKSACSEFADPANSSATYCRFFPPMDPDGALATNQQPKADVITGELLARMAERFKMADEWTKHLSRLHKHFDLERKIYLKDCSAIGASPQSSNSGGGGGFVHYVTHFEKSQKSFGTIRENDDDERDDKEVDQVDAKRPRDNGRMERTKPAIASPTESNKTKPSVGKFGQFAPNSSKFTPVNTQQSLEVDSHQTGRESILRKGPVSVEGSNFPIRMSYVRPILTAPYVSPQDSYHHPSVGYSQHDIDPDPSIELNHPTTPGNFLGYDPPDTQDPMVGEWVPPTYPYQFTFPFLYPDAMNISLAGGWHPQDTAPNSFPYQS